MRFSRTLETYNVDELRSVATQVGIPVKEDGRYRKKDSIINDMRSRFVYPAIHGSSLEDGTLEDLVLAIKRGDSPASIGNLVKNSPKLIPRTKLYKVEGVRSGFGSNSEESPYDLREIASAADVESYIATSIRRHREQVLKESFFVKSKDPELQRYVNNRLFELSLRSPSPINDVIREFATNLIKYHTAFICFERDITKSTGSAIVIHGKLLEPISGIYPADPVTMRPVISKARNRVIKWEQIMPGDGSSNVVASWPAADVLVCTVDKKSGFLFGTPYILPVLDDVRALRRLEELALIISVKHAFPLMHWKVGTETKPVEILDDGTSELALVRTQAEGIGSTGAVITNERSDIKMIGSEGAALDLEPYLKYFDNRVISGLRLSQIDLGRANQGSKATGHTISKAIEDASMDYQACMSEQLGWRLLLSLALEGGYDVNMENMPKWEFNPINVEEQRSRENHCLGQFQGGAIDHDELRNICGREPFKPEQMKKTNVEMFQLPTIEKTEKIKAEIKAKNQPANQSGKKATKTRVTANNSFSVKTGYMISALKKVACTKDINAPLEDLANAMEKELKSITYSGMLYNMNMGIADAAEQLKTDKPYVSLGIIQRIQNKWFADLLHNAIYTVIIKTIARMKNSNCSKLDISVAFDVLEHSLNDLYTKAIHAAYRSGFIKTARIYNKARIKFVPSDTCGDCKEAENTFDQKTMPLSLLIPQSSTCSCKLEIINEINT